ncbi:MAG: ketopantoate reductase family protein [Polyangiales bacterium]
MSQLETKGRTSSVAPRILLVGAGAVGQVYGQALQRGGAHVSFLVRAKYKAEVAAGLLLYRISGKRGREAEPFMPDGVYGHFDELKDERFDQVWLCVSTPAAQSGIADETCDLGRLIRNLHGATLVVLQAGPQVTNLVEALVPARQRCDGGIAMISYQAPLVPDEVPEPGVAYWTPTPSPFEGADDEAIVALLRAGGCPAKVAQDTRSMMSFGSATLMPTMVALEGAGWKVSGLRRGPWARLATHASREARNIVAKTRATEAPAAMDMLGPVGLKGLSFVAPAIMPFDLDVYLRYHFSKVHDQTRLLIDHYVSEGERVGLPTAELRELRSNVFGSA